MPEKGWAILTVREDTAKGIKEQAHAKGFTEDEFISQLMSPAGKADGPYATYAEQRSNRETFRNTGLKSIQFARHC